MRFQVECGDKEPEGQCVCLKPGESHRKKPLVLKSQNSGRIMEINVAFKWPGKGICQQDY